MKKKWIKPSLQVIVRHKPEERVLATCKYASIGPIATSTAASGCRTDTDPVCQSCTDVMPS